MTKFKVIITFCITAYMLMAFQNCGSNEMYHSELSPSNPNSDAFNFLSKLSQDADIILNTQENLNCEYIVPQCSDSDNECIKTSVVDFYKALECKGFKVVSNGECFLAISNDQPVEMESILIDATCIQSNENDTKRSVNMGTCLGEDIGFNRDAPSTGMLISSWLDLGNEFPFTRRNKQMNFYPNQKEVEIFLAEVDSGDFDFIGACGKSRKMGSKELSIPVKVMDHQ